MASRLSVRLSVVLGATLLVGTVACSDDDEDDFPLLANYDRSCQTAADCTVVAGEGCSTCAVDALNAKAAQNYTAARERALRDPDCQEELAKVGACQQVKYAAACNAARCAAVVVP